MPTRAEPPARQGGLGFLVDEFDDATIPVPASAWRSTVDPGVVVHSAQIERRGPGIYGILVPVLRVLHAEEGRLAGLAGVRARTTRPVFEVVVAPASAPHPAPVAPRAAGVPDDVPAGQRRLRKLGQ